MPSRRGCSFFRGCCRRLRHVDCLQPRRFAVSDVMSFAEADYQDWIGRHIERTEPLTPRLIAEFATTLAGLIEDRPVPLGLFWVLAPDIFPLDRLGRDGHPNTGIVLPALPLPRRMWAGGELTFHREFLPGDIVTRSSVVEKLASKQGSSGPLGFVSLRNRYSTGGSVAVEERQDIVYREDPKRDVPAPSPSPAPNLGAPRASMAATPTPVLLFRYSAVTFNGHRVHYDHPYAVEVEGYEGLVVHGPMQAIFMMNLATRVFGRIPTRFTYRGVVPLICGRPILVEAHDGESGSLALRVRVAGGPVTMTAQAFVP